VQKSCACRTLLDRLCLRLKNSDHDACQLSYLYSASGGSPLWALLTHKSSNTDNEYNSLVLGLQWEGKGRAMHLQADRGILLIGAALQSVNMT